MGKLYRDIYKLAVNLEVVIVYGLKDLKLLQNSDIFYIYSLTVGISQRNHFPSFWKRLAILKKTLSFKNLKLE